MIRARSVVGQAGARQARDLSRGVRIIQQGQRRRADPRTSPPASPAVVARTPAGIGQHVTDPLGRIAGSTGKYAAPAFSTASNAVTRAVDRSTSHRDHRLWPRPPRHQQPG